MTAPGISYTEGSAMDQEIQKFSKNKKTTPDIHYRTSSRKFKILFLVIRMGIDRTEWSTDDGWVKNSEMPELKLKRNTYLAMRKGRELSKNAQKFFGICIVIMKNLYKLDLNYREKSYKTTYHKLLT